MTHLLTHWAFDSVFYHVYPLGMCGAPARNDGSSAPAGRLDRLHDWIAHWQALGVNALYLGPVFESATHGYDTSDYFQVDRRLGTDRTLRDLVRALHDAGIRVILDGVFNHVGRGFWAFRDVQERGSASPYCGWFAGLRFDRRSALGDPFGYDTWEGHPELVKLNLSCPAVREHLLAAVETWMREFAIDGLRLDAADCVDIGFLQELGRFCRQRRSDFWLLGEVIHGDYSRWANPETLDATTNYECYKGLYSSFNDRNCFEIAHSLGRQFGAEGVYRGLPLYAFADNHDVNRIGSTLRNPAHLYPLHLLLFTMPGVPAIYYGSEWALEGIKERGSDAGLRPPLAPVDVAGRNRDLVRAIAGLARIRHGHEALRRGDYEPLHVASEQLAFRRRTAGQTAIVALNAADRPVDLRLRLTRQDDGAYVDVLNGGERVEAREGELVLAGVPPTWGRVFIRVG